MAINEPQFTCKGVTCHPVPVVRACYVPEVVVIDLPFESEFPSTHVHHRQSCRIGFSPGGSPIFRIIGGLLLLRNLAMSDDGKGQFILTDDSLVGHPVIFRFTIDRTQIGTICIDHPSALGCLSTRFPAEDDFARMPRISLYMPYLEVYTHDVAHLTCGKVYLTDTRRACPIFLGPKVPDISSLIGNCPAYCLPKRK